MRYLPTGEQMRRADQFTIEQVGIPSLVLMERAAIQVVAAMEEQELDLRKTLVVCGGGNNGGDGFAVARLLKLRGYETYVWFLGNPEHASTENRQQMRIAQNCGVAVGTTLKEKEYTVVIDAVFGTGLKREITGAYKEAIGRMNDMAAVKVAVDIPSGVSDEDGSIWGAAVKADYTVALAFQKLGTLFYPGRSYCGDVLVKEIGIEPFALPKERLAFAYERTDLKTLLPKRREHSNKGDYGKVLLIAGSFGMSGAAYLCAKAAYAVGAGLVRVYTAEANRVILQQLLPEAVITTYETYDEAQTEALLDWADVAAVGSGLSVSETAEKLFAHLVLYRERKRRIPLLIDADGLNILSARRELYPLLSDTVVTPHIKEMSRLTGKSVGEIQKNMLAVADEFSGIFPGVCVLKDARTIVSGRGTDIYINTSGNAAMAKAGSGDVLAGMITGLMAQSMSPYEAGALGVFLHGLAGDEAKKRKGSYSVLASDLTDSIGEVIRDEDI